MRKIINKLPTMYENYCWYKSKGYGTFIDFKREFRLARCLRVKDLVDAHNMKEVYAKN